MFGEYRLSITQNYHMDLKTFSENHLFLLIYFMKDF